MASRSKVKPSSKGISGGKSALASRSVSAPASQASEMKGRPALGDLHGVPISWTAGTVVTGNGSVGDVNAMYLQTSIAGTVWSGVIPVIPYDVDGSSLTKLGSVPLHNTMQNFRTIRYRKLEAELCTTDIGSSTTSGYSWGIAPIRGGNYGLPTEVKSTGGSVSSAQLLNCQGGQVGPTWKSIKIDLTPYIAGGYGAHENEFRVASALELASTVSPLTTVAPISPAYVTLGGTCTSHTTSDHLTAGLLRFSAIVDMLDCIDPSILGGQIPSGKANRPSMKDDVKKPDTLLFATHPVSGVQLPSVVAGGDTYPAVPYEARPVTSALTRITIPGAGTIESKVPTSCDVSFKAPNVGSVVIRNVPTSGCNADADSEPQYFEPRAQQTNLTGSEIPKTHLERSVSKAVVGGPAVLVRRPP